MFVRFMIDFKSVNLSSFLGKIRVGVGADAGVGVCVGVETGVEF